jgi:hypothetical protein
MIVFRGFGNTVLEMTLRAEIVVMVFGTVVILSLNVVTIINSLFKLLFLVFLSSHLPILHVFAKHTAFLEFITCTTLCKGVSNFLFDDLHYEYVSIWQPQPKFLDSL